MDPERWPDVVRFVVDQIGEQAGTPIAIEVDQIIVADSGAHYGWLISSKDLFVRFQLVGHEPRVVTAEPAWYAKLSDLPPGG